MEETYEGTPAVKCYIDIISVHLRIILCALIYTNIGLVGVGEIVQIKNHIVTLGHIPHLVID